MHYTRHVLLVAPCLCVAMVRAAHLEGKAVAIAGRDTLTAPDAGKAQHRIRLAGTDAPERKQAFGNAARQDLGESAFQRRVNYAKTDRYCRLVGKVLVDGQDANLAQITAGLAWHYKAYQAEQSTADRESPAAADRAAREARLGQWQEANPEPSCTFRERLREARVSS